MSAEDTSAALPPRVKDIRGQTFGRLTVLSYSGRAKKSRHATWLCSCCCSLGTTKIAEGYSLIRGFTQSCGCLRKETSRSVHSTHGKSRTPEYYAWSAMLKRCRNKNHPAYKYYGARGITVCDRWLVFENFLEDMGPRPGPEYSLDRLDNNLGYTPLNCAWRTRKQQQRNRRGNKFIEHGGERITAEEWGERIGVSGFTVWNRIRVLGWSIEKSVTTPKNKKPHRK